MKVKAKAQYKKLMFNLSAKNHPLFLAFYKYLYKPKAGTLSSFIDLFSRNNDEITVVQIGANDGFDRDPIHKFIKRDNWKGVLLEPQKEVYEQFLEKLHRKSKGIHTVNAALDYNDGAKPIYKIAFSNARWATGLTTFDRPVLEKALKSDYVLECAKNEGIEIPTAENRLIKEEEVAVISPATLINKYNLKKIDWLQIDTEGFDYEVIKMFNIQKTQPKVLVFEHYHLSKNEKQECYDHLIQNQYKIKEYGRDTLAIRNPEPVYYNYL